MDQQMIRLVADILGRAPASIRPEDSLVWDLLADSMSLTELVCAFESAYGIALPDAEMTADLTVAELLSRVSGKLPP